MPKVVISVVPKRDILRLGLDERSLVHKQLGLQYLIKDGTLW